MLDIQELSTEEKQMIAIGRDERIFKKFFIQNFDGLKLYAFSFIKDEDLAQDISCEILWKIWNLQERLLGIELLVPYILRAVKNKCLNHIRKKSIEYSLHDMAHDNFIDDISPESLLISKEKIAEIEHSISLLPAKTKQAFLLVKDEQLSYKQAAAKMGIAINTVDRHLQIALKKIYAQLKQKK
ncbi:sigma-70 family RNA polymerase sigma factor [Sphingobacterium siyangense]|uniref:sigma-70 family RNA polymerase sigma factor n=1 Tax=Sphingobacterium siyangense TaxID=459529 RepID=UPI003DA26E5B